VGQFRRAPKVGAILAPVSVHSSLCALPGGTRKSLSELPSSPHRAVWNLRRGSEILMLRLWYTIAPKGPLRSVSIDTNDAAGAEEQLLAAIIEALGIFEGVPDRSALPFGLTPRAFSW